MSGSRSKMTNGRAPSSSRPELRLLEVEPVRVPLGAEGDSPGEAASERIGPAAAILEAGAHRLQQLDGARVFATWAVLWVHVVEIQGHSAQTAVFGRFGTSFYVAAVALYGARAAWKHPQRGVQSELMRGARRLLRPFLLWSLLYAAFYGVHAFRHSHDWSELMRWWGPFAGTCRHLWFLPFAWATGGLVTWFTQRTRSWPRDEMLGMCVLGGIIGYLVCYGGLFFLLPRGLLIDMHLHRIDRWVEELPLVFVVTSASLWALRGPSLRLSPKWAWLAFAVFALVEAFYSVNLERLVQLTSHQDARYISHLAGLSLFAGFLLVGNRGVLRRLGKLRHVTYFTYLSHIMVLEFTNPWVATFPGFGTLPFAILTTTLLFAVCACLGTAALRVPGVRRLAI